tara:strand:+ start:128 stop:358 length:231 start_codon:yes stop_codon:yes gene_type:complete
MRSNLCNGYRMAIHSTIGGQEMNKNQERLYRNLYDAVNDMFNQWDELEDIRLSDLMSLRKAKIKVWQACHKQWEEE